LHRYTVEYIVNPVLEEAYERKKADISALIRQRPPCNSVSDEGLNALFGKDFGINETFLFHGTSLEASENIIRHNFCPSKQGSAGRSIYGKGFYFSEDIHESRLYACENFDGGAVLICRVLEGRDKSGGQSRQITRPYPEYISTLRYMFAFLPSKPVILRFEIGVCLLCRRTVWAGDRHAMTATDDGCSLRPNADSHAAGTQRVVFQPDQVLPVYRVTFDWMMFHCLRRCLF
jgi:hypothetical protein